jgi:hypothetical protein
MRLLGRNGSIEIESRDDAIIERSDARGTKPLPLVSVGPFHKAFGAAISQGDVHLGCPFRTSGPPNRYGIDLKFYQAETKSLGNMTQSVFPGDDFPDFVLCFRALYRISAPAPVIASAISHRTSWPPEPVIWLRCGICRARPNVICIGASVGT